MKRIAPFVFIAFAAIGLLGTPSTAFALPPCPEDQNVFWDNCFGTYDEKARVADGGDAMESRVSILQDGMMTTLYSPDSTATIQVERVGLSEW